MNTTSAAHVTEGGEHPDLVGKDAIKSRLFEGHLQDMARRIMSAHEGVRKKLSRKLQNEIAQTMLGIHVKLLALKKEVAANNDGFTKEIAATQRLLEASMKNISRLAGELGIQHES